MTLPSVLFLGAKGQRHCEEALAFCRMVADVEAHLGDWGQPLPESVPWWEGDIILSYNSRWILSEQLIVNARVCALNFHPAPPEYPGIGGPNFALYNGAETYGVTCHHMAGEVDSGPIVDVERFPILPQDGVASLLARTYAFQLAQFFRIVPNLLAGNPLPVANDQWGKHKRTRAELNALYQIDPGVSAAELTRIIRATSYEAWQPKVTIGGQSFILENR